MKRETVIVTESNSISSMAHFKNKKIRRYSDFERRDFPFVYLLVLFPILQFVIFWVYVNASSIGMSFISPEGEITFDYFRAVKDAFFDVDQFGYSLMDSLTNSLKVWVLGSIILFFWGIVVVYVLCSNLRGHYFYRLCEVLPGLIGSVIWVAIMRFQVEINGPVMSLFQTLGIELPDAALHNGLLGAEETAFPTLLGFMVLSGLVTNSPVLSGAYARVPDELYESADIDGAGYWRKFFAVALPSIWPTVTTLMIFNLASIFTADCSVFLYTNGSGRPGCSTVGFQLYVLTLRIAEGGSTHYGYPAALGVVLTLMTLPIALFGRRFLEKLCDTIET